MTVDQANRLKTLLRWHRRLAVVLMAWLAVLAATGIAINHANDWGLDRKPLPGLLTNWVYGMDGGPENYCRTAPQAGSECNAVFGRIALPSGELLLARNSLFLIDGAGRLVEKLPVTHAGLDVLMAGAVQGGAVYLRGESRTVRSSPELLVFRALDSEEAEESDRFNWQSGETEITVISWERLLLDTHAARFLGPFAKAFNDIVAGAILLLVISGFGLHILRKRNDRN